MSIHIIIDGYNLIRQSNRLSALDNQDIQLGREALLYMLAAYKKVFFGEVTKEENKNLKDVNKTELLGLIPLTIIAIWLGIYPKPVLEPINNSVESVVQLMHDKAISPEAKSVIPSIAKFETREAH